MTPGTAHLVPAVGGEAKRMYVKLVASRGWNKTHPLAGRNTKFYHSWDRGLVSPGFPSRTAATVRRLPLSDSIGLTQEGIRTEDVTSGGKNTYPTPNGKSNTMLIPPKLK